MRTRTLPMPTLLALTHTGSSVLATQPQAICLHARRDCCVSYVYLTTEIVTECLLPPFPPTTRPHAPRSHIQIESSVSSMSLVSTSTLCVRGLDILKLQLFVLHNTDIISSTLSGLRFLLYNKQLSLSMQRPRLLRHWTRARRVTPCVLQNVVASRTAGRRQPIRGPL